MFVGPPPQVPHAEIGTELERIRAIAPQQVKDEIMRTYPRVPAAAQPFVDDPAGTLAALVRQMRAFWAAALAPWWARMSAVLESEIASRARRLVAAGPQTPFTGLHQAVRWDHDALVVHTASKAPADVDLPGGTTADPGDLHLAQGVATHRPAMGSRTRLSRRWHRQGLGRRRAGR